MHIGVESDPERIVIIRESCAELLKTFERRPLFEYLASETKIDYESIVNFFAQHPRMLLHKQLVSLLDVIQKIDSNMIRYRIKRKPIVCTIFRTSPRR